MANAATAAEIVIVRIISIPFVVEPMREFASLFL
jgi:hypothetical protein